MKHCAITVLRKYGSNAPHIMVLDGCKWFTLCTSCLTPMISTG